MVSGDSAIASYGCTAFAPMIEAVRSAVPTDIKAIGGNVMLAPHPLGADQVTLRFGRTNFGEADNPLVRLSHFKLLRDEACRFLADPFVPTLDQLDETWMGSYPCLGSHGALGETPVVLRAVGAKAVAAFPPKERGWTDVHEVADLSIAEAGKLI